MTQHVQTGKTTWIRRMLQRCGCLPQSDRVPFGLLPRSEEPRSPLLRVAGVYTPAVFEEDDAAARYGEGAGQPVKTAIDAVLLPSGERFCFAPRRTTAELAQVQAQGMPPRMWNFQDRALGRINAHLAGNECHSCDLLLVDELGWLEFERGEGYVQALRLLDDAAVPNALVVVRADLLHYAHECWDRAAQVVELSPDSSIGEFIEQVRENSH